MDTTDLDPQIRSLAEACRALDQPTPVTVEHILAAEHLYHGDLVFAARAWMLRPKLTWKGDLHDLLTWDGPHAHATAATRAWVAFALAVDPQRSAQGAFDTTPGNLRRMIHTLWILEPRHLEVGDLVTLAERWAGTRRDQPYPKLMNHIDLLEPITGDLVGQDGRLKDNYRRILAKRRGPRRWTDVAATRNRRQQRFLRLAKEAIAKHWSRAECQLRFQASWPTISRYLAQACDDGHPPQRIFHGQHWMVYRLVMQFSERQAQDLFRGLDLKPELLRTTIAIGERNRRPLPEWVARFAEALENERERVIDPLDPDIKAAISDHGSPRAREACHLREQGLTYTAIGRRLGITRQAVHQMLNP